MADAVVFAPNAAEPRIQRRVRSFELIGLRALGVCFRRERFNRDFRPEWPNVDLGVVRDRHYVRRIGRLATAFRTLHGQRDALREARVFYAIGLDMGLLALAARRLSGSEAVILYETADVLPIFLRSGPAGRTARTLERHLLRRVDTLVVTSPAFVREYFAPVQGYRGPVFLLENKPSASALARAVRGIEAGPPAPGGRWRVGWFGALRCERSFELILRLADALPDRVEFHLAGRPTRIPERHFSRGVEARPNVNFHGEYEAPDDLERLYRSVDLTWGFEFADAAHNSRWLLPNRLYEGGAFAVPLLAYEEHEVGRVVADEGIGWTFGEPLFDELAAFLGSLTTEAYRTRRAGFERLPSERFTTDRDWERLCAQVGIDG